MRPISHVVCYLGAALGLLLTACGGGSADSGTATPAAGPTANASSATSSGTISAFGSVFVNGHEFDTRNATVIDDDTGAASTGTAALEVGMTVDVKAASASTNAAPVASELHVHPLVSGVVDATATTGGTLTVLGQSVQLTASTNFSDHRACLTATTSPCTAIAGQSGLSATSGAGSAAVPGTYVTVYGYLYAATATAGSANIVATLVAVNDVPTTTTGVNYKAEGVVTVASGSSITIGKLAIDLTSATCRAASGTTACASAYSVGQVVSAYGTAAPALPAATLTATVARLRTKLAVETAGAAIELEGKVANVATSPASFAVRGVTVDASALSGSLPANGDIVRVLGTVATGGTSVTATSVTVLHAARSATVAFEGDFSSVAAGTGANTFVLTVLGRSIGVSASTRLADRSTRGEGTGGSSTNPFNITTFQTYLASSTSKHLLVRTQSDASGNLSALSVTIVGASVVSSIGGTVDAAPAPANGASAAMPTTFAVHGLAVSASPASVFARRDDEHAVTAGTVSAGDLVLVRGTFASGTLTVAAPTGTMSATAKNVVVDFGTPTGEDHDGF